MNADNADQVWLFVFVSCFLFVCLVVMVLREIWNHELHEITRNESEKRTVTADEHEWTRRDAVAGWSLVRTAAFLSDH